MKIVEKRKFKASASELWEIVHDPGNMPAWNPKCVSSEPLDAWEVGQRFEVIYEMNGKRSNASGELFDFKISQLVHFRYHYEDSSKLGIVDEIIEIIPKGNLSTLIVHTVDFSRSTLPLWVKLLLGVLGRFGKKMGEGSLDGIASLLPENSNQLSTGGEITH